MIYIMIGLHSASIVGYLFFLFPPVCLIIIWFMNVFNLE